MLASLLLPKQPKNWLVADFDEFEIGQVRRARVTSVVDFGAFVQVDGFHGLIHASELGWSRFKTPHQVVLVDDQFLVVVVEIKHESRQVGFSRKRLLPNPTHIYYLTHRIGGTVTGRVLRSSKSRVELELATDVIAVLRRIPDQFDPPAEGSEVRVWMLGLDRQSGGIRVRWRGPRR